jgi:hypothetical protein
MVETFLSHPIVLEAILPFLLVFAVVFAVLQKTEALGKDKKGVDAIVALVIGLIVIAFGKATGIIVNLIPFLAIGLIVIFVFLVLWGFVYKPGEFNTPNGVKWAIGVVVAIFVVIIVLVVTGGWGSITDIIQSGEANAIIGWVIGIVVVIGAVLAIILGGGNSNGSKSSGDSDG